MAEDYDHAEMAKRIGRWLAPNQGAWVGTMETSVEVDPRTMSRILDAAEANSDEADRLRDGLRNEMRMREADLKSARAACGDRDRLAAGLRVVVDEIDSTHAADPNSAEAPSYLVDYVRIADSLRDAAVGALADVFGEVPDGTD